MSEFILELENKPNNKIEYKKIETKIDDIEQNAQIKECIVCVESEDKGKLYKYEHCCGKYYIHQNCLHEWILKNGNDCIVCRENTFTNPETIAFLTLLITLRDQIENNSITIVSTPMISDNIIDNEPNFGIKLEQTYRRNDYTQIIPLSIYHPPEIESSDNEIKCGRFICIFLWLSVIAIFSLLIIT